ncbi:MAG: hypothetical protein ACYS8Z_06305 [Planctomycetota bacterium]|jgi:hypothetical protein
MNKGEKDETLVRQTISRLLDFHGMEVKDQGDTKKPVELDKSIQAPSFEHLEYRDPIAAAVEEEQFAEGSYQDWEEPLAKSRSRYSAASRARQRKMILLIPLLSVLLLLVLNKFHGMPLLGSEWLRLGTYQKMVGEIVESGFSSIDEGGQNPVRLKVRGVAFTSESPSAVIGTTIVHEGDVVLGATVMKINRGSVEFKVNGETWTQKVQ